MIRQGDVWWASFLDPDTSEAGLRRPVLVVQGDAFNRLEALARRSRLHDLHAPLMTRRPPFMTGMGLS